jgi:ribosomal-protein-alanine N-acetyltransferase
MPKPPYVLTTSRLRLRELTRADLDVVERVRAHAQRFWGLPQSSRDDVAAWLDRHIEGYARVGYDLWGVELAKNGELIGDCGLVPREIARRQETELAYHLLEEHWGRGYATEAARASLAYGHSLGLTRIVALILPANLPSQAVARRVGMRPGPQVEWFGLQHVLWEREAGVDALL